MTCLFGHVLYRQTDHLHNRPGGQAAPNTVRRVPLLQRVRDELPLPPAEHIRNRLLSLVSESVRHSATPPASTRVSAIISDDTC
jgi:hypothetical protein